MAHHKLDLPRRDTAADRAYSLVAGTILSATAGILAALLIRLAA